MAFNTNPTNNTFYPQGNTTWLYNNGIWKKLKKAPFSSFKSPTANFQSPKGSVQTGVQQLEYPVPTNKQFTIYVNMRSDNNLIDINSGSVRLGFQFYNGNTEVSNTYYRWAIVDGYSVNHYQHGFDFHQNFSASKFVTGMKVTAQWNIPQVQSGSWRPWTFYFTVLH